MKKLAVLLCFSLMGILANAQTILTDAERDEYRLVQTSFEPYAETKGLVKAKYKVALRALCEDADTTYQLITEIVMPYEATIGEGSKLLLKLSSGETITAVTPDGVRIIDNERRAMSYYTFYYLYPAYTISKEDLGRLMDDDCVKLRFECDWENGFFDTEVGHKKVKTLYLSSAVKKLYAVLSERVKESKNLYEDF